LANFHREEFLHNNDAACKTAGAAVAAGPGSARFGTLELVKWDKSAARLHLVCGNTVAMVNAVCDRGACFRNRWPTFEKLNVAFFAAATPRCKYFGERTRGILRDNDSRFSATIVALRFAMEIRKAAEEASAED
jgi:hypothetical protein